MKVTKENLPEIAATIEKLSKNKVGVILEVLTDLSEKLLFNGLIPNRVIEKVELNDTYISIFTKDIIYFLSIGDYFNDYPSSKFSSFTWKITLPDRKISQTFQVTGEISIDNQATT